MLFVLLRKIASAVPIMLIVALIVFSLLYLAPGDPATIIAGDQATPEVIAQTRVALGLNQPFLLRFGTWIWHALGGDLGSSLFSHMPVTELIGQRIGATVSLMLLTLVISVVIGIPLGVWAAWRHGMIIDRVVMVIAVIGFSVPAFVIGYLLAYTFGLKLKWLPTQGYAPISKGVLTYLSTLILPATTLSGIYVALIARVTRATMLDVISQDFIRTARAKGVSQRSVLFHHALRNAAIPIVTVIGIGFASLLGGAVVTETVFSIPGIGRLVVDSILRRDYPVIQGVILVCSLAYVVLNLLIDVLYTLLDPRVRH